MLNRVENLRPTESLNDIGEHLVGRRMDYPSKEFDKELFLLDERAGEEPHIIADTTWFKNEDRKEAATGHMDTYHRLVLPERRVLAVPTTRALADNPEYIKFMMRDAKYVMFRGGEDLGERFRSNIPPSEFAVPLDKVNPLRDEVNSHMMEAVKELGHNIFFIGICRGLQLLAPENLVEVSGHRPPDNPVGVLPHEIVLHEESKNLVLPLPMEKLVVPSNHHLQLIGDIPPDLREAGWRILFTSPFDNGIAGLVRVDDKGVVTGISLQDHIEKAEEKDEPINQLIDWIHQNMRRYEENYPR